ncbi:MAG TPA: hypothetical protein VL981_05625, partial [Candidatus Methylacidiphilales bacterium]|nr:hypothetical protein [Candidatus Methylacidiphilales bacterium]
MAKRFQYKKAAIRDFSAKINRRTGLAEFRLPHPNRDWLGGMALILAIVLTYTPVWWAGFIWDDAAHVTPVGMRSMEGLRRIWFYPGATQQYYPLIHSIFWVEHRLWGDAPLAYHLVNIVLFSCSALLLLKILRRL